MDTPALLDFKSSEKYLPWMGGKGSNLYALSREGLAVPSWFCLSAALYQEYYQQFLARIEDRLAKINYASRLSLDQISRDLQETFQNLDLPELVEEDIRQRLNPGAFYAVRSSALGEDSALASFAGQLDSYLYIAAEDILSYISACWASAFNVRLLVYLHEREIPHAQVQLAVIIQEMVPASAAGVMFMANPTGPIDETVIVAGYGLGEGIVSDSVESDTYIYQPREKQWQIDVVPKFKQVVADLQGGTLIKGVDKTLGQAPVLKPEWRDKLLALGKQVQASRDYYQDIEWAMDKKGDFWLLQTRPITTIPLGAKSLFDNSNIVESYPGPTSVLTFSYIKTAYEILFRNSVIRLGVPRELVFANQTVFKNMLAYLQGRVYYNLSSWYQMFRLVPGTEKYIEVWEEMMGIERAEDANTQKRPWRKNLKGWFKIGRRLLKYYFSLEKELADLRKRFNAIYDHFWALDHHDMDEHALIKAYDDLCSRLLYGWEITVLNDGYTFIFSGLTKHFLKKAGFEEENLFNNLLCGVAGMESVEPVRSVVRLAETVRKKPDLFQFLEAHQHRSDILLCLKAEGTFMGFVESVEEHLQRYGDRSLAELKLETPSLRDHPQQLLQWVLAYVPGQVTVEQMEKKERAVREDAEKKLKSEARLNPLLKPVLYYCLKQARRCINYREASRLDRARSFGLVRRIFRVLGNKFAEVGVLEQAEDIFELTVEEISGFVYGSGVQPQLKFLVTERQRLKQRYALYHPAEQILTQGPVYLNLLPEKPVYDVTQDMGSLLRGTGCAPGHVTAKALVIRDPVQAPDTRDKILVAEMTDPGWVFLMVPAAGLIVEKGSLLSHTAIIGRELGIPTVVGVKNAMSLIQNGAEVTLNGQTGEVELSGL